MVVGIGNRTSYLGTLSEHRGNRTRPNRVQLEKIVNFWRIFEGTFKDFGVFPGWFCSTDRWKARFPPLVGVDLPGIFCATCTKRYLKFPGKIKTRLCNLHKRNALTIQPAQKPTIGIMQPAQKPTNGRSIPDPPLE